MASRSVIERRDFLPLMREEPEIALRLIEILCSRLRRTTEQAEEVMFLDLPSRLAKALMRLVDADIGEMRERKILITQKDLGNSSECRAKAPTSSCASGKTRNGYAPSATPW
jgi:CRP-like cAMP-binding protein